MSIGGRSWHTFVPVMNDDKKKRKKKKSTFFSFFKRKSIKKVFSTEEWLHGVASCDVVPPHELDLKTI